MLAINFDNLEYMIKGQKKNDFYIWDYGKSDQQLIEEFAELNIEQTKDGSHATKVIKRGIGKGLELATLDLLKEADIVEKRFDPVLDGQIKIEHEEIIVKGRIDAITKKDCGNGIPSNIPVCIRYIESIDDTERISRFVGQLAMMMYFTKQDKGLMILYAKDVGYRYLECEKVNNGIYTSEGITVNVIEQLNRFAKIMSSVKNI